MPGAAFLAACLPSRASHPTGYLAKRVAKTLAQFCFRALRDRSSPLFHAGRLLERAVVHVVSGKLRHLFLALDQSHKRIGGCPRHACNRLVDGQVINQAV